MNWIAFHFPTVYRRKKGLWQWPSALHYGGAHRSVTALNQRSDTDPHWRQALPTSTHMVNQPRQFL
ncbi:hypothetical protein AAH446_18765 [Erwinia sp. P6884]|uniref:hypothetical protein n=1 Tax=Erwinia sp. P6884 TaxID=3141450 RepID=UPI00318E5D2C